MKKFVVYKNFTAYEFNTEAEAKRFAIAVNEPEIFEVERWWETATI